MSRWLEKQLYGELDLSLRRRRRGDRAGGAGAGGDVVARYPENRVIRDVEVLRQETSSRKRRRRSISAPARAPRGGKWE